MNGILILLHLIIGAPWLCQNAMLKIVIVKLKPVPDLQFFFEKGIRRGILFLAHRYNRAKNRYVNITLKNCLLYLSGNNLWSKIQAKK